MNPNFTIDRTAFAQAAKRLQAARRVSFQKLLRDQAKLFVRDLMKLTPPRGRNPISETYNDQRRRGEKRVTSDIARVFVPAASLKVIEHPQNKELAEQLGKAIRRGDLQAVEVILQRMGIQGHVALEPDPAVHENARNSRGRVRTRNPTFILRSNSLKRYIKRQVGHVGKAKAGWLPAANALGVETPQWISRHGGSTPGYISDQSSNPDQPSITVGNLVVYASSFHDINMIEVALRMREASMKTQTEKIIAGEIRKAGGAAR